MKKFEVGKSYWTRSPANYDCIFTVQILSRTEKSVTVRYNEQTFTRRVKVDTHDKHEYFMPFGSYSMAPCINAGKVLEA